MKVFVTGCSGYIGAWVTYHLQNAGHEVVGNYANDFLTFSHLFSNDDFRQFLPDHAINVRLEDLTEEDLEGCDAVVHLAGVVGEPACTIDIGKTFRSNVLGTENLVNVVKNLGIERFIHISTCSVYGLNKEVVDEMSEVNPVDWYAVTKYSQELLVRDLDDCAILRLGTVYGWSPAMRFDLVVNLFGAKFLNNEKIKVFGGYQMRPFVHCEDVAVAILEALQNGWDGTINVVSENLSILQVAKKLLSDFEVVEGQDDPRSYLVSNDRIVEEYGFEFQHAVEHVVADLQTESREWENYNAKEFQRHKMLEFTMGDN